MVCNVGLDMKRCKYFECRDKGHCPEGDLNCLGCGGAAFQNCGCDACVNQSWEGDGDVEVCLVALDMRSEDMEERECIG